MTDRIFAVPIQRKPFFMKETDKEKPDD